VARPHRAKGNQPAHGTLGRMARLLFELTPVPATMKQPGGPDVLGLATCRVDLIEPADNAFGADFPDSVRSLRKNRAAPDGSLRSRPPEHVMATTAEAVVPRDLLNSLPDDALIAFRWGFSVGGSCVLPENDP
jgi:hypothetical protein